MWQLSNSFSDPTQTWLVSLAHELHYVVSANYYVAVIRETTGAEDHEATFLWTNSILSSNSFIRELYLTSCERYKFSFIKQKIDRKTKMANSTATTGTSIDALVKEGKALGSIWRQVNSLKQTIKENGFDTRLGKLLQQLKASSTVDSGQIPTHVLRTHGIQQIDRRRRSEALWFVENEKECREFIANGNFKGSSLTALQAAMRKAAKADDAETTEGEVSNVGQSEPTEQPKADAPKPRITHKVMVNTILAQAELNGLDLEKIIEDLMAAVPSQQVAA
jgi:hypothetical protein